MWLVSVLSTENKTPMPCPSMWPKQFWSVQKGFGLTKLIWNWPQWFGHDQNEMVTTKMNWSSPKLWFSTKMKHIWTFILVVTISIWSWPNHYCQVQINLVGPKSFWTDQNCFDHIEGRGISHFCFLREIFCNFSKVS